MDVTAILLSALGIVATCVGGLIWVIKYGMQRILPILEKIHASIDANTRQTADNTAYLKERNGRDSKFWGEVRDALHIIMGKKSAATTITRKPIVVAEKPVKRR